MVTAKKFLSALFRSKHDVKVLGKCKLSHDTTAEALQAVERILALRRHERAFRDRLSN
jgi:hypothetical protein